MFVCGITRKRVPGSSPPYLSSSSCGVRAWEQGQTHSTTSTTGCMLFRHEICTALFIASIWGWKWGWTKAPLDSSTLWGCVNRKFNCDVIYWIRDFLLTCKVMSRYCKSLSHYAVQFGHWYWCLLLVSYSLLFSACTLFLLIKLELTNAWSFILITK